MKKSFLFRDTLDRQQLYDAELITSSTGTVNWIKQPKSVFIGPLVDTIDTGIFQSCHQLSSITIPESIYNIEALAFNACHNLSIININLDGNSLIIGENAFLACSNLTEIHINSLEDWCGISLNNEYSSPFYSAHGHLYINGQEVAGLEIPKTVSNIGNYAFYGLGGVTSINIGCSEEGDGVYSIGDYAFCNCHDVDFVYVAETVNTIGEDAFKHMNYTTNVVHVTMYGKTMSEVSALYNYPWGLDSGSSLECIDGTILL